MRKSLFLNLVLSASARTSIICLLAAALAMPVCLHAGPVKSLGMWVWSESAFSTDEARQKLVRFCVEHQINHLDVYVTMCGDKKGPTVQNAAALRNLIVLAGMHNISTAALRGNPEMFYRQNHEQALQELRAVIAFYKTLPVNNLFKGIKYDVEPYGTKEWKAGGESRKKVMFDYLTFLSKARDLLRKEGPSLWLAADTPFWWDKDAFVMEFEGKTKRFSEHVQDLTDFIVVMSYRRNVEKVLNCVVNERRYAREINKVIFLSLETVKLKQDPYISFWGLTIQEFWDVVFQLQVIAKTDPATGGVMIHCYRSLMEKSWPPAERQEAKSGSGGLPDNLMLRE